VILPFLKSARAFALLVLFYMRQTLVLQINLVSAPIPIESLTVR